MTHEHWSVERMIEGVRGIPRPAGDNAGLRDDAVGRGLWLWMMLMRARRSASLGLRVGHLLWLHQLIKFFAGEVASFSAASRRLLWST